jgi:hypothetical protein
MFLKTVHKKRVWRYQLNNDKRFEERGEVIGPVGHVVENPTADDNESHVVVGNLVQDAVEFVDVELEQVLDNGVDPRVKGLNSFDDESFGGISLFKTKTLSCQKK